MTFVFILSAIAAIVTALLVVPLTAKRKDMMPSLISLAILSFIVLAIIYYVTNLDRNWTALWPWLVLATLAGTILSRGNEQKLKGVLFLGSLGFAIFMLSAPFWNADDKYEVSKMAEQVEIEAFDETKTPASVPPKFARNKMKKAFGQVPNTSYYELGNLQIQKIKDEYVYIAPVEFSGIFKWWNGDITPGYFTNERNRFFG